LYSNYNGGMVDDKGSVTKRLWSYTKSQRKDNCSVAPLKMDGVVHNMSLESLVTTHVFLISILGPLQ